MKTSRRKFLSTGTVLVAGSALSIASATPRTKSNTKKTKLVSPNQFDPWIELIPEAMRYNVKVLHRLANQRPILAVVKNNGYGLGQENIAAILADMPEVVGFAAVKTAACLSLSETGVTKPILHMGMATPEEFHELASKNIQLSIFSDDITEVLAPVAKSLGRKLKVHQYIDTGMSRMGIRYDKALPWMTEVAASGHFDVRGTFMGFTEDEEYDKEQLQRLLDLTDKAAKRGINSGRLHAASSHGIYHFTKASLDMVRPGIGIYGAYPANMAEEKSIGELRVAYRLKTRVVRVEKLKPGDSVSYNRNFIAEKPTWVATLPIGHSDGYPRNAVKGVKVLINNHMYPVIGAVSASHTILNIGDEPAVAVGDEAILVGPDHPEIHPNYISQVAGVSVYDILMHMSANLPKTIL